MAILPCSCSANRTGVTIAARQQDRMYGKGRRVHTDNSPNGKRRCTVCGAEKGGR